MRRKAITTTGLILLGLLSLMTILIFGHAQETSSSSSSTIPKTWDEEAIASLELPLSEPSASPKHVSADYYYRIPVRPIYKSYPVYHPSKEPPGYMERLKQQEPQVIWGDNSTGGGGKYKPDLETEADWIRAGELVFDSPLIYDLITTAAETRDPAWYAKTGVAPAKDGTMPYLRYVIRKKGVVELGNLSCASCHTRMMPDGTLIKGAQGNFPFDRAMLYGWRTRVPLDLAKALERSLYGAPWLRPDPQARLNQMLIDEVALPHEAVPPGVIARHRSSPFYPPQVADLIGVKDRRYLDKSGLVLHRSIGDLMRYAAMNQGGDDLSNYAGFIPADPEFKKLPDPGDADKVAGRYSDEQLYALAKYIYSLQPPPNPNKFDALAARGRTIFDREGCAACHTPPLYTNNKLTPAEGFNVPEDHLKKYDILPISVGTDPNLTLKTRRGTGYYKVPSLKGVWYRGPFEHNGTVATLEDWFDPARLRDDYVPTGFKGYGVKARPVKGHVFGLDLSEDDRKALIAFLKTL